MILNKQLLWDILGAVIFECFNIVDILEFIRWFNWG